MEKIDFSALETFPLKNLTNEEKILLLNELGLNSDGTYVLTGGGEQIQDKYLGVPVGLDNMLILPGSTVVLDDNELSVAMYLQEYGNDFG